MPSLTQKEVDERALKVLIRMAVAKNSHQDISDVLGLAFNLSWSPSKIQRKIQEVGCHARAVMEALGIGADTLIAALDEVFAGKAPILMGVDPVSQLWVMGEVSAKRDQASWEKALEHLPKLVWAVSDLGSGLTSAIQAKEIHFMADLFHARFGLGRSLRSLEAEAYRWMEQEYALLSALHKARENGKDLRSLARQLSHVRKKMTAAIERVDWAVWLTREIMYSVSPDSQGRWKTFEEARPDFEAAVALLASLHIPRWKSFQGYFKADRLLQFLKRVEQAPGAPVVRASSAVEGVNARVQLAQQMKKHLSQPYLDLLRYYHNVTPFRRGKRKRKSPLELAGIVFPYENWLDPLLHSN